MSSEKNKRDELPSVPSLDFDGLFKVAGCGVCVIDACDRCQLYVVIIIHIS